MRERALKGAGLALLTLSGRRPSQRADELATFLELLATHQVQAYLEIGARHGDTFYDVVRSLPTGSRAVAVDMPAGRWGAKGSAAALAHAVRALRLLGYDTHMILGDSHDAKTRAAVASLGPYGAVFIDADHGYLEVRRDWLDYGPMAPLVAFHDIDGEGRRSRRGGELVEVPRLWAELTILPGVQFAEIVGAERGMGIGVIFR